MSNNNFQEYLDKQGISKAQAAEEIGCSRQYIYMLANGQPAGKRMAAKIERWSGGYVSAMQMMGLDRMLEESNAK